ncbi:hypothetical protein STEG23_034862 [Scotinomys teguina]
MCSAAYGCDFVNPEILLGTFKLEQTLLHSSHFVNQSNAVTRDESFTTALFGEKSPGPLSYKKTSAKVNLEKFGEANGGEEKLL